MFTAAPRRLVSRHGSSRTLVGVAETDSRADCSSIAHGVGTASERLSGRHERGVRQGANHSQIGHLARIRNAAWRRAARSDVAIRPCRDTRGASASPARIALLSESIGGRARGAVDIRMSTSRVTRPAIDSGATLRDGAFRAADIVGTGRSCFHCVLRHATAAWSFASSARQNSVATAHAMKILPGGGPVKAPRGRGFPAHRRHGPPPQFLRSPGTSDPPGTVPSLRNLRVCRSDGEPGLRCLRVWSLG